MPLGDAGKLPDFQGEDLAAGLAETRAPLMRPRAAAAIAAGTTVLLFGATLGHELLSYDDDLHVAENPVILGGDLSRRPGHRNADTRARGATS